jgi:glycerophosphoryl diester phosphodiesterase
MLIYAHRGASGRLPENTLRAFRAAIDDGADGVELDLHATADGVPVVIHDRDLARTTNGNGDVDALTLAELRSFDAGGEPVPTFAEVLDLLAGRLRLDVEIKQPGIERQTLEVLARYPHAKWAISSFDWDVLHGVRRLSPRAELWPLAVAVDEPLFAIAGALASPNVALAADAYNAAAAIQLRQQGLGAVVWTVNDPDEARAMRDLGARALCTDEPAAIRAALA